jgi:hypothetical protein
MKSQSEIFENEKIPDYLFFCLKNRLILINYNLLLIIIGTKVIDYINEWNLLKNNKVPNKKKYYINYLNIILKEELLKINKIEKLLSSKSVLLINKLKETEIWVSFFENYINFNKHTKSIIKKIFKYSIETDLKYENSTDFYKSIKIIKMNGEEEEFFKKILAKLKLMNN